MMNQIKIERRGLAERVEMDRNPAHAFTPDVAYADLPHESFDAAEIFHLGR